MKPMHDDACSMSEFNLHVLACKSSRLFINELAGWHPSRPALTRPVSASANPLPACFVWYMSIDGSIFSISHKSNIG